MKIDSLFENVTPSSTPVGNNPASAPKFGRNPKVLEDDKIDETSSGATGSGSVASVSQPIGSLQKRQGTGALLKGIKTSEKFPNSKAVKEEEINEQDIIINPVLRKGPKPGFHNKHDHEGDTVKNSLHTIVRVAKDLNNSIENTTQFPEWVSEKIGAIKHMMVTVMDYVKSQQERGDDNIIDELTIGEYGYYEDEMSESNVFTDARMNAIKAGKKKFSVNGKTYKVTGDISDELNASKVSEADPNQQLSVYNPDGTTYRQKKMPSIDAFDIYNKSEPVRYNPKIHTDINQPEEKLDTYEKKQIRNIINHNIDLLKPREKQIIAFRFFKDKTLEEVANIFSLSRDRVRQIEAKALRKLRHALSKNYGMDDDPLTDDQIKQTKESVRDTLYKRQQELRTKSKLPDPNYYKELLLTYDLPDQERFEKMKEIKKKYGVK